MGSFPRILLVSMVLGQACATLAAEGTKVPFETYDGYFVSNKFEPNAPLSFAVIGSQDRFDKIFGVAMVMRDKSHRLAKDAFESNMVLTAIKRDRAFWTFKVEGVSVEGGVVVLRYSTTSKQSNTATFACPLIVSIPKGKYNAVRFVENRKTVKELKLK